ncbi:hypothetical protein TH53_06735 [Pedobacter lusitanus]|uniref:DUF4274 domain-containing protein n=1 Tax=Pedobacter lusitanus TaxID=1503925 RepID=A0A0D0GKV7_9SPHI|nr:DUF4274 domain-containing protein [Pedobacter lusitanus]KIO77832.1 hypothetical protein TH53_06735 [Pedobacter lusitanus]
MTITFTRRNKNKVSDAIDGKVSYKKLTAEEWHQFVQNYNYDDGNAPFEWLIRQKICDKGTALCLYWHLQPDFYCHEKNKTDIIDQDYLLIQEIEKNFSDNFYESEQFSFDPIESDFFDSSTNTACIPKIMLEKTNGILFNRIELEVAFLRNPNEKELKTIDKKVKNAVLIIQEIMPDFVYDNTEVAIDAIVKSVEYWKGKDLGKMTIKNLSYLWLDCLHKKYEWDWIMWDWETGASFGVTNKTKELTCLADTIINHTIDDFQPTSIISDLFKELNGISNIMEMKRDPYSGIGLLFSSDHLAFYE